MKHSFALAANIALFSLLMACSQGNSSGNTSQESTDSITEIQLESTTASPSWFMDIPASTTPLTIDENFMHKVAENTISLKKITKAEMAYLQDLTEPEYWLVNRIEVSGNFALLLLKTGKNPVNYELYTYSTDGRLIDVITVGHILQASTGVEIISSVIEPTQAHVQTKTIDNQLENYIYTIDPNGEITLQK